ncbi:MAG TPA: pyruvate kinase [Burkholderiales bacterium]|nr:pyruvate kinase [Burkholderiales bacterium]
MKQTKIVATIGPTSSTPEIIEELIKTGVDVFRLNFSHGNYEIHKQNIINIRKISQKLDKHVAIMGDLQGPKIRITKFINDKIILINGQEFILDVDYKELGNNEIVGVTYPELIKDVKVNDILILDDGKITLLVNKIVENKIFCTVTQGGELSNNKGINKLGGGLTAPALTIKDFADIEFASNLEMDYLAISFVKDATDIALARKLLASHKSNASIIAKIERVEAITNMEQIICAADGLMVARGDLAIEVGDAQVPALQKKLIKVARRKHKLSIVATQMLESMITSPVPTRAEISDIANAVLDGTDAVMLSAETASGHYPIAAVAAMARTCIEAEKNREITLDLDFVGQKFNYINQAIAMSALFSAYHLQAKAIIALTTSGKTALWLSRVNSGIPIFAITSSIFATQKMALYKDVRPIFMPSEAVTTTELLEQTREFLLNNGMINIGDTVLITMGEHLHEIGGSNTMKIIKY